MDHTITHWINAFAGGNILLDQIMIAASRFGVPLLVLVTVLQWWSKRERLHVRHACVAASLSFLLGLALNQIILLFVHRVRPYDAGVTHLTLGQAHERVKRRGAREIRRLGPERDRFGAALRGGGIHSLRSQASVCGSCWTAARPFSKSRICAAISRRSSLLNSRVDNCSANASSSVRAASSSG